MEDTALIELIKRSPDQGLSELIDSYIGLVYTVVKNRLTPVCSKEDIEECVNDTFIEFYRSINSFDSEKGTVKGYLCAIGKRVSARAYSKKLRDSNTLSIDDEAAYSAFGDDFFTGDTPDFIERQRLIEAIISLGEPDREIIVRKFYLHEPSKSIAKRLKLTVSAVDTRTHRALKKLKEKLSGGHNQ